MHYSFGEEVIEFVIHINSLQRTLPLVMMSIRSAQEHCEKVLAEYVDQHGIKTETLPGGSFYNCEPEYRRKLKQLVAEADNIGIAYSIIPKNFVVSLVSQFDAYLGRIIRTMYYVKPELLNASEKIMSFSQLVGFGSIDDAKEYIIEKEVEAVLRRSHTQQFEWLEDKLDIPLRKGLDIWADFIELTERRNLFVHCNGVISSQYINVCKSQGVELEEDCKSGKTLTVTNKYYLEAYKCLFEIGVKLAHVIWRKLQPEDMENADSNLNEICYDLLVNKKYDLALRLLKFASSILKKYSSEESRLLFTINEAQAYKWSGQEEKCRRIINKIDWSAYSDKFKLASYVLLDDFEKAAKVMEQMGPTAEVSKAEYKDWPLFKEFRKSEPFSIAYLKIFKEDFGNSKDISIPVEEERSQVAATKEETLEN